MNKGLKKNTVISHYKILSEIGRGGMGEVYLAEDTKLNRKVAIKFLNDEFSKDADKLNRFIQEAKAASALNHPNIITIYEIGESVESRFIALEYIRGETLTNRLKKKLRFNTALDIATQIASALDAAHAAGIVHRDIKPDNVMIRDDGLVKVLDFGIAKLISDQGSGNAHLNQEGETMIRDAPESKIPNPKSQMTTPGMIIGTANYMSPEQARGKIVDHRTDIFSFGVVFYEMLSGRSLFAGETVSDTLAAVLTKEPEPLEEIPVDLEAIVRKTLQKDKLERYQTAEELLGDLRELKRDLEFQIHLEQTSSPDREEQETQMLPASATTEKRAGSTTGSEQGFRVAVLPFRYRGAGDELEALAEGVSEEIVTGLSRFSYLRVIAHGSTLEYESDGGDVREVSEELGARYVMEGSVRQVGGTIRLAVKLVDTETGEHLWAATFDRDFSPEAVFELQDELVPQVVSTVADWYGVLPHSMSEAVRYKSPDELNSYEALLRSFGYFERIGPEEHAVVRDALERAVAQVPGNADAWAMLSMIYGEEHRFGFNERPDSLGRALEAAKRAVDAAHGNHFAWLAMAQALFFRKEFGSFRDAAERAVSLNPMDGATIEYVGHLIAFSGDWERGCELSERARLLNPNHPGWYWSVFFLDAYRRGDYENARTFLLKAALRGGGAVVYEQALLASLYGQLEDTDAAQATLKKIEETSPGYLSTVEREFAKWYLPELVEQLMEGLRKAGVDTSGPDGDPGPSREEASTAPAASIPSIAVLPFTNMSAEEDNEYFCDGLAEELINALSRIEGLKVAARTSAFSFKGTNTNIGEIGEKLQVENVLEGSVRKSGNNLRIAIQLVSAAEGFQIWSERYDRELKDIFDVQDEITLAVVEGLKVELLGEEKAAILKRYTDNPEALEFYLRGLSYFTAFTPENFEKAIASYESAIAVAPGYAPAYAGLAECYSEMAAFAAGGGWMRKAKAAARKAIELDDTLGSAHNSLAVTLMYDDREFPEAEREYRRALELEPGSAHIHMWYAWFLGLTRRFDEGFEEMQRARELDPLSPLIAFGIGAINLWRGRTGTAIEHLSRVIELSPAFTLAYSYLAEAYVEERNFDRAIATFEDAPVELNDPFSRAAAAYVYGKAGNRPKAEEILKELEGPIADKYSVSVQIAQVYAGLGENERAMEWFEKACRENSVWLIWLGVDPSFDPMRSDPRFVELVKRMGLPSAEATETRELEAETAILRPDTAEGNAGVKNNSKSTTNPTSKIQNPKSLWLFGLLGLIILTVGFFGYKYFASDSKQIESIAVMPFVNESENEDVEYLSDGMTETLIKSLSNLPNLSVKARSSVFRYKGKEIDIKTIGKELNVQAILNGRISQRSDGLSLNLELVDAQSENVIWSEQYNRKQSDLVSLQSEIARDVSTKLKTKLSGADVAKVEKKYTTNPEAFQLYLKGRFHWNRRTPESLRKAVEFYQQAIEKDPNYALAYSGLAETYVLFSSYSVASAKDSMPQSKAAAERALKLDESVAEAHAALGEYLNFFEFDRIGSERAFRRAIELNPNYATAYQWLGSDNLGLRKRFDEAFASLKQAEELDPLSPIISMNHGLTLVYARRYDEAIEKLNRTFAIDPNFSYAHIVLGWAYHHKRMYKKAIAAYNRGNELNYDPINKGYLALSSAKSGQQAEAKKLLNELKQESVRGYVPPYAIALCYIGLNDKANAFIWLEKEVEERGYWASIYAVAPELDELRGEPRFKAMLKQMNLPN